MAEADSGTLDVLVCGTLVADMRVRPFQPIVPRRDGTSVRRVDEIRLLSGGIVANTGLALARLGVAAGAIGRLGDDAIGAVVLAALRDGGMDTGGIRLMPDVQTAPVIVCIDERGERTFHFAEGANTLFDRSDLERNLPALRRARAIALGYLGELPHLDPELPAVLAWLKRETGAHLLLETAGEQRRHWETFLACLPAVDLFLPSWEEARDLTGARTPEGAIRLIAEEARPEMALGIKLGARGCLLRVGGGRRPAMRLLPAYPTTMVDATGAGDAFLAGFLAGHLHGVELEMCARLGNMAGALTVGSRDGQRALPTLDSLIELVGAQGTIAPSAAE